MFFHHNNTAQALADTVGTSDPELTKGVAIFDAWCHHSFRHLTDDLQEPPQSKVASHNHISFHTGSMGASFKRERSQLAAVSAMAVQNCILASTIDSDIPSDSD